VIRIEGDGPLVLFLRLRPLPLESVINGGEGEVSLGEAIIQSGRARGSGLRFRESFLSRDVIVVLQKRVRIGQSRISQRVVRILFNSTLKIFESLLDFGLVAFIPVVAALQVELVSLAIFCSMFDQLLLFSSGKLDA